VKKRTDPVSLSLKNQLLQKLLLRIRPAFVASFLKKIFKIRRITIETKRGRFYIDPVSNFGKTICQNGDYEPSMTETLQHYLHPSSIFIDVGANEGYFSVIAANLVKPTGKVISVEPQQRLRPVLEQNFKINGIENISLFNLAISDAKGLAALHVSPDTNTGSTSLSQSTRYKLPTEIVNTITLKELLCRARIHHADLLKMDIEGFEYEAIFGSRDIFKAHRIRLLRLNYIQQ